MMPPDRRCRGPAGRLGQGQRMSNKPILLATRGSALALAQANLVLAQCREKFPALAFRD